MKKLFAFLIVSLILFSCNKGDKSEKFILTGEIKNIPDQKIFLEQLYFSQKDPEVLDTAEMKNGQFKLSTIAPEEGLYRIRLEKQDHGFLFINDKPQINFKADLKDISLEGPVFNTPANGLLKKLMIDLNNRNKISTETSSTIDLLKAAGNNDSLLAIENAKLTELGNGFKNFIIKFIDTTSNPVIAMFALGYTGNMDPKALKDVIPNLEKRFPKHLAIAALILQYNQFVAQQNQPAPAKTGIPQVGDVAPDFTLNDVNDKPFSLSSLKGKFVLVDFWASWCGPCRGENPYVVAAFNKYKDKNFTILGVSLDEDKAAWIQAIKDDHLSWQQVSDLKGMNSPVGSLYGINGIPYNVLIDPAGKIIASSLRENLLDQKLSQVLQ